MDACRCAASGRSGGEIAIARVVRDHDERLMVRMTVEQHERLPERLAEPVARGGGRGWGAVFEGESRLSGRGHSS